jgi:hypothetical protein
LETKNAPARGSFYFHPKTPKASSSRSCKASSPPRHCRTGHHCVARSSRARPSSTAPSAPEVGSVHRRTAAHDDRQLTQIAKRCAICPTLAPAHHSLSRCPESDREDDGRCVREEEERAVKPLARNSRERQQCVLTGYTQRHATPAQDHHLTHAVSITPSPHLKTRSIPVAPEARVQRPTDHTRASEREYLDALPSSACTHGTSTRHHPPPSWAYH